jgi:hypothetical protein
MSSIPGSVAADNGATIGHALAVLARPGQVVELRIPNCPRNGVTTAGYFNDFRKLSEVATRYNGRAAGVYVTLNEINPALLARLNNRVEEYVKQTTSDADVLRRRWFPSDFDPVRPAGIPSTDAEHKAALQRAAKARDYLSSLGWPMPAEADSANGGHLLYAIDLPNDEESLRLVNRCLATLDWMFSDAAVSVDTTVGNAARIWKLYGTLGHKGDGTSDRTHRVARLLAVPDPVGVVPRDLLEALAAKGPPEEPKRQAHAGTGSNGDGRFELAGWVDGRNLDVSREGSWKGSGYRYVLGTCPWNSDHTDNSAFIVRWPSGVIGAGCHHNGCQGKGWHELRDLKEPGWRDKYTPATGNSSTGQTATVYEPRLITSAEFDAGDYALSWLVKHVAVKGQPLTFGGGKKLLKTSIVVDFAVSVAGGRPFLGQFFVPEPCRVAVLSGESGQASLQNLARRVAAAKGLRLADLDILWGFDLPQLADATHLGALQEAIEKHGIKLLFLDPLYLSLLAGQGPEGLSASNLYQIGPLLLAVAKTCLAAGCTPALVHHFKLTRRDPYGEPQLEDLAFAGIQEFSRQWILLGRRSPFDPDNPEGKHELWLSAGGSAGHSLLRAVDVYEGRLADDFTGRTWRVEVFKPTEARAVETDSRGAERQRQITRRQKDDEAQVLEALDKLDPQQEGKATLTKLRNLTHDRGLSRDRCDRAVDRLAEAGVVVAVEVMVEGGSGSFQTAKGYQRAPATVVTEAPAEAEQGSLEGFV